MEYERKGSFHILIFPDKETQFLRYVTQGLIFGTRMNKHILDCCKIDRTDPILDCDFRTLKDLEVTVIETSPIWAMTALWI